ncbi:MAG TPA: DUF4126 family protein [Candidatus Binatia bacterium]|nr:DUF4126 family protein [Candidatus Binatia bacterium]
MSTGNPFLQIIGLGAICGLRSMSGPALLARYLHGNQPRHWPHAAVRWLSSEPVPTLLALMAGGELVADKLPLMPARIEPLPLAGRAASGALVGAILAGVEERPALPGAVLGAVAAVLAATAGYHARRFLTQEDGLPDPLIAVVEDALVLGVAKSLMS